VALLESAPKILNLNYRGENYELTIESAKEKQAAAEQAAKKQAAQKRVRAAVERAANAKKQLFK
jgi:hypothetical protein